MLHYINTQYLHYTEYTNYNDYEHIAIRWDTKRGRQILNKNTENNG